MVEQPGAQANAAAPSVPKSLRIETPTTDPSTARVDRSRGAARDRDCFRDPVLALPQSEQERDLLRLGVPMNRRSFAERTLENPRQRTENPRVGGSIPPLVTIIPETCVDQ